MPIYPLCSPIYPCIRVHKAYKALIILVNRQPEIKPVAGYNEADSYSAEAWRALEAYTALRFRI